MPFIQENLDLAFDQSRFTFNTYVYSTEDTCDDVQYVGYFNASRFALTDPVNWRNGVIEVSCSDGFGKGYIDEFGNFKFFITSNPLQFCAWMDFNENSTWETVVRSQLTKTYTLDTSVGGAISGDFVSLELFDLEGATISFEQTFVSASDFSSHKCGIAFYQNGAAFVGVVANNGTLEDLQGNSIGSYVAQDDYKWGITFDSTAGTAIGYDNQGNSGSLFIDTFDFINPCAFSFTAETSNPNNFVLSPNTGDRPFDLPQSTGIIYCDIEDTLCPWIDYVAEELGAGSSFFRDEATRHYNITTFGGGFQGFNFTNKTNGFVSAVSLASFELTAITINDQPSGGAVFFVQLPVVPQDPPIVVAGFFNQGGTLVDSISGLPFGTPTPFITGYIMGITFDFATGTCLASDNDSLSNYSLAVGSYNAEQDFYQGWTGASGAASETTNVFRPNSGNRPFALPESTGVGFCRVEPLPDPELCIPVNLVKNEGVPPNNQLMTVNNLTVTSTSLGNVVLDGGGAGSTEFFQTSTQEVKIEQTMLIDSTFNSPAAPALCGIGFVKDLFGSPEIISAIGYTPNDNGGAIFDIAGGTVIDSGLGKVLMNQAAYLDPTPQQKKYAFQVNSGVTGSVDVHGVVTGVAATETEEQIANNIIANGFTDLNIESLAIGSDPRTVIITYTLAAGDYPVSVIPTNVTITPDPSETQNYQTGKARGKIQIAGNPSIIPYDAMVVSPIYSNLDNIYMISYTVAGDGTGGQLQVNVNFGSGNFALGEDAERWCNL